jgi:uncharacterized protein YdaU (DUF1376 family)
MNYYKRHIGDYHKKAGRLSMLEHGAYTLLIDACYDRERFPTKDEALDWCWARTPEECSAVEFVLSKFFELVDGVYVQARISDEVAHYHANAETNRRIAQEREAKRRERVEHEPCTNEHEPPPNHKPITKNQEPVTKESVTADGGVSLDEVAKVYNEVLGDLLSNAKLNGKTRQSAFAQRVKSYPKAKDLDWWRDFFSLARTIEWMMGKNASGWKADLDYFLSPKGFTKVIEGNYQ